VNGLSFAKICCILTASKLTDAPQGRLTMRPQFFKVTSGDTFYMGKEGSECEAGRLYVGSVLCVAVANENRTLGGQRVGVVLFKIGPDG